MAAAGFNALLFALCITAVQAASLTGKVVEVTDGNTVVLVTAAKKAVRVRLHGIRAPAARDELGARARQELSALVLGRSVLVDLASTSRDGSVQGRVSVDKLSVNAELARRGLAWWNRDEAGADRALEAAEAEARSAGRGMWGDKVELPPKNSAAAAKWYQKAAEKGSAEAQYILGIKYYNGDGVPKNRSEAAKWIRQAADAGLVNAQAYLGSLYRTGEGVPKDATEAVKWLRRAAEQDQLHAQVSLGTMYSTGEGVPKDLVQAYAWSYVAGPRGQGLGLKTLAKIEPEMTPEQKAEALKMAGEYSAKLRTH